MTQTSQRWPAPAKLNLMLHITGQRADGYHELQTLFQFLDVGDELAFEIRNDGLIQRSQGVDSVPEQHDLVIRAAKALQAETACAQGVDIAVFKNLPMGAGLGGGSSDAATTLHALNHLWGLDLDTETLTRIGLSLGADIPVFVNGFAAFAEGIGERLTPVELDQPWYLVLVPPVEVSTAEIFRHTELTRDCPTIKICDLLKTGRTNVCTPVVVKQYPQVAEALELLGQFADAQMSGTGGAVFAAFEHEAEAKAAESALGASRMPDSWTRFVTRGCNESPLIRYLSRL